MATISGRVIFDRDRSLTFSSGDSGLANIPIVLQNVDTAARLTVLTDANGNYAFINVPNGSYRIVESYGTPGGVPTPGDFSTAVPGSIPQGVNPPISAAPNPPPGATNLDSVTPDTLLVTVTGADLTNQNFFNGPVIYTPIQEILDQCVTISGANLINVADQGTFGTFPQGTPANTGAPVEPYPGVTPDFEYVLPDPDVFTPMGGQYTVQNIMNNARSEQIGAWWRISDHTAGNETGRMMVVNGFNPGAIFFKAVVPVQPNTNYLFTAWILNLFKVTGYPDPELGVVILDENGDVLYSATLGILIPVNINAPEWKQIGTVINSRNNTRLTVEFLSEGPEVIGNDYAIDDISFNEVQEPLFVPVKTVSTSSVNIGETVTYTVTLTNTCESPLTDVFFRDLVPNGLTFVPGSVTVNGLSTPTANPNNGFDLPNVPSGGNVTVRFEALASAVPTVNPTLNSADVTYSYTPVEGGIPSVFETTSNEVPVTITAAIAADMAVTKTASPDPVAPGETLTYTIVVTNFGPNAAENVVLTDTIAAAILAPQFSINGGAFQPWPGTLALGTFAPGETRTILIRGTVSDTASGIITNTATVSATTPDPDPENNTSTVEVIAGRAADLSVVKTASSAQIAPGDPLTYTIVVRNLGPDAAENALLTDAIPAGLLAPQFAINGGPFQSWPGTLSLGTLPSGASVTVLIRGTASDILTGNLSNTARVSAVTPDPDPENNTSTVVVFISGPREQAITDIIESVALEEAGLAHILNAEGEKLQRIIAMPDVSAEELLQVNKSVRSLTNAVTMLETILAGKLRLFGENLCNGSVSEE